MIASKTMNLLRKLPRAHARPAAGAGSCRVGAADRAAGCRAYAGGFLQTSAVPDIRRSARRAVSEGAAWSAAIAQLVEHVIRNDGVTGSSPVCGTISFIAGIEARRKIT